MYNDGNKNRKEREEDTLKIIPSGYIIDSTSDSKRTVFINHDIKEVVISHRGTVPTDVKDLAADASIALNISGSTARFKTAIQKDKKIKDKYKPQGYSIIIVGHSLGGKSAYESAKENKLKAYLYNAAQGGSLTDAVVSKDKIKKALGLSTKKEKKAEKNITSYYTKLDPVSVTARNRAGTNIEVKQKKGKDVHTIDNFL
jgi:hypothetical protein